MSADAPISSTDRPPLARTPLFGFNCFKSLAGFTLNSLFVAILKIVTIFLPFLADGAPTTNFPVGLTRKIFFAFQCFKKRVATGPPNALIFAKTGSTVFEELFLISAEFFSSKSSNRVDAIPVSEKTNIAMKDTRKVKTNILLIITGDQNVSDPQLFKSINLIVLLFEINKWTLFARMF